jgi:hypothetical protein
MTTKGTDMQLHLVLDDGSRHSFGLPLDATCNELYNMVQLLLLLLSANRNNQYEIYFDQINIPNTDRMLIELVYFVDRNCSIREIPK